MRTLPYICLFTSQERTNFLVFVGFCFLFVKSVIILDHLICFGISDHFYLDRMSFILSLNMYVYLRILIGRMPALFRLQSKVSM